MTTVALSHHLGLMWVAIEATTLATAPLIYFNHNARSLEATWKYLLIGSVGIALALLGSFFLAYSALAARARTSLLFEDLVQAARRLSRPWLHAAFVLLLVGYGTKMGLAPMHTWKPDAYGEAPGLVGALLAGGRHELRLPRRRCVFQVCAAGDGGRSRATLLIGLGLLSMAVAAVFMVAPARLQADARLLERRAHGDPRPSASGSAALARSARSSTRSTTGSPRACCSSPPATSTAPTAARRPTTSAARPAVPGLGRCSSPGSSRSPARRRSGRSSASSRS